MNTRLLVRTCLAAATALVFWGCASGVPQAPQLNPATGQHPAAWEQTHFAEYLKNPDSCKPCHGSTTDKAQAGGTSKVSCFGCHHPKGPHHTAGWADASQHGRLGAQMAPNGETGFAGTGFATCTKCHGTDYAASIGIAPSCKTCHTTAPHAAKPWHDASSPLKPNHDKTDKGNAAECAKCHTGGANSSITPKPPAPAGTSPSCYNGTLCHTTSF